MATKDRPANLRAVLVANKLTLLLRPSAFDGADRAAPAAITTAWRQDYLIRTMALNSASLRTTALVHATFKRAGIEHTFFKGPVQHTQLHGDAFARPSGDCDVLVTPADFDRASRALLEEGFVDNDGKRFWWRQFLGERPFRDPHGRLATVDLHQKIQQPGCPDGLAPHTAIARSTTVVAAGETFPILDACDTLILVSSSIAKALVHREPFGGYAFDYLTARAALSAPQAKELERRVRAGGLEGTFDLVHAFCSAFLEPAGASPFRRGEIDYDQFSEATLRQFAIAPWLPGLVWPRRRELLWHLCSRRVPYFVREWTWAGLSEVVRRLGERSDGNSKDGA